MAERLLADPYYRLWVLFQHVSDTLLKAREKELSEYGISAIQARVLFVIKAIGNKATPTEISRWLLREPNTVSSLLTRMEKEGLVSKTKNTGKKKQVYVTLTEKGERAYDCSVKNQAYSDVLSCLSEEERQKLELSLRKIQEKALQRLTTVKRAPFP